jgi:Rrf2 family iron-sulfur cluster assembly transcriptional regulator
MLQIGKTAQNAIAIMSYLAECYRDQTGPVNSQQAADARGISKALTAKILTTLSGHGFLKGSKGPGGGYLLTKNPKSIRLMDIVSCFELQNNDVMCPFGEGWCWNQEPCPLHDEIQKMKAQTEQFLCDNDFGGFAVEGTCSPKPGKRLPN